MTTDHIQKLAVAQCITCDKYYKTDATLFAHIAAAHDSEGGDLNALSRPLRYTGHIKAKRTSLPTIVRACIPLVRTIRYGNIYSVQKFSRNQVNTPSSRETDVADVGSGRQSAKIPIEKANSAEVSGVEDKDIPPTRGTPIVPSSNEECVLSSASSIFGRKPQADEGPDLNEDGRRQAGNPSEPESSAQGRDDVEHNTSYPSSLQMDLAEGDSEATIVEAGVPQASYAPQPSVPTNVGA